MIGFSTAFLVYFPENEKVTYSNDENKSLYKSGAFQFTVYNKNEEGPNQVVKWQKIKNIFDKRSLFEILAYNIEGVQRIALNCCNKTFNS